MLRDEIVQLITAATGAETPVDLSVPDEPVFGHFSTNIAMKLAKARGEKPIDLAQKFATAIREQAPDGLLEKVEVASPGFINVWLTPRAWRAAFAEIASRDDFGTSDVGKKKTVIVEYSAVNVAKPFHLG